MIGRGDPMTRLLSSSAWIALASALLLACSNDAPAEDVGDESGDTEGEETGGEPQWPTVDLDALPYEYLSEYGFFIGEQLRALEPAEGVYPYTVVSPLFSDFAGKARFLYLPEGEQLHIDFDAADPGPGGEGELWEWPVGSVLIKNFYFDLDRQSPGQDQNAKLIETRLMVQYPGGWQVFTYVWDDAEQDAVLTKYGKLIEVGFTDVDGQPATQEYKVPSLEQCGSCHSRDNTLATLGPVTHQMNYAVERDGGQVNQMQWLESLGLFDEPLPELSSFPTMVDPLGDVGTLDQRARSYLHANCSHCHRQDGGAGISGLRYPYWEQTPVHLGICKPPAAAGAASGGRPYDIVPGDPEQSIVVFRMESLDPMIKMPELPSRVLNPEGIQLISDWIAAMEPAGCGGG
jgi:uncharacterized repeat protein (TIGR03806 family)